MKTYQHYYLIGNEIKKGIEKPNCNGKPYCCENKPCESLNWLSSLQPCEISESELHKIEDYLGFDSNNPIDVTDIVEEKLMCCKGGEWTKCTNQCASDGKHILIFKHPKQVDGEIEAVELWKEFFNMQMVGGLDLCKQHFNITRKNI